jgi:leucine-rich repeat/death domain-containing protein
MSGKVGRDAHEVMLQTNELTRLPPTLLGADGGWWRDVRFLCVSANALVSLPPAVGGLAKLEELNLNDNRLESLPPELFSGCTRLSVLHLNNNRLRALPSTIGQCQALKVALGSESSHTRTPHRARSTHSRVDWCVTNRRCT